MLTSMRVSVIIPVLNEQDNLAELLPSLQDLRDVGHEIIVVDGGSADNSQGLGSIYADKVISSPCGRARQMNVGAAQASGDVLFFLHADNRLSENTITEIKKVIQQDAQWGRFDVRINDAGVLLYVVSWMMNIRSRLTGIVTGDQGLFVRRDLFEKIAGYADIPLMEDIEISSRLKQFSRPVCLTMKIHTSSRRWRQNGVFKTIFSMWKFRLRYWLGTSAGVLAASYYPESDNPHEKKNDYAVLVFAKAPVEGQVKTRLCSVLSENARSALQAELNEHAMTVATETGLSVELWTTDIDHYAMRDLAERFHAGINMQIGDELGERMRHAVVSGLQRYKGVILIGSDCPVMNAEYIHAAVKHMESDCNDVVLGPAEDGGYVLLATRRLFKPMFRNIQWSTNKVYEQSIASLQSAGLKNASLVILWDIDRPEDYYRYQQLGINQAVDRAIAANA